MSANNLARLFLSLSVLAVPSAHGADAPRGRLIEVHSCEVFAGACMVSSQATLAGRTTLQVWDLAGGSWDGMDLGGLQVAVLLQSSTENLAAPNTLADQAVIYLSDDVPRAQSDALASWLRSRDSQLAAARIQTRRVRLSLTRSAEGIQFEAGPYVSLSTVAAGDCENRVCGESLWYEPSTPTSIFTVAVNAGSVVREPLLKLMWTDFGKRSVFVARFGVGQTVRDQFVQSSEWCAPSGLLF